MAQVALLQGEGRGMYALLVQIWRKCVELKIDRLYICINPATHNMRRWEELQFKETGLVSNDGGYLSDGKPMAVLVLDMKNVEWNQAQQKHIEGRMKL